MKSIGILMLLFIFTGCAAVPHTTKIKTVDNFEIQKYLGTWY